MFFAAQIFGFLAWLSLLISYYRKNTNKILVLHILSIIFYLLNYLFLGAWAGLFIIIVELLRDFLYYKTDKDNLIFNCTIPIYILLFIIYRDNIVELIPIVASLFEGFTLTKKKIIVVPGALIVYSMWVIYDLSVGAYTGALTDGLIVISNIGILINMIKGFNKVNKFKLTSRFSLTRESMDEIIKLKKDIYVKELLLSNSYEEKLYNKNHQNLVFIKHEKELKGYITTITTKKDIINKLLDLNDINEEYEELIINNISNGDTLIIDSIVMKEKYQNKKSKDLIIRYIKRITSKFKNIIFVASTEFENEIATALNLKVVNEINNLSIIYKNK